MFFFRKKNKVAITEELRVKVKAYFTENYQGEAYDAEFLSLEPVEQGETEGCRLDSEGFEAFECQAASLDNIPDAFEGQNMQPSVALPKMSTARQSESPVRSIFGGGVSQAKRSLADLQLQLEESFARRLFRMIDERGMTDSEVYNRAGLDRRMFAKIRKNLDDYRPARETALALAIGLKLNLDETLDLLGAAGIRLSRSIATDVIVMYFIENSQYDIISINLMLDEYGLKPLTGARDGTKAV